MCLDTFDKRNLLALNKVFGELSCVDQLRLYSCAFENRTLNRTAARGKPTSDCVISSEPKLMSRVCIGVKLHLQANTCLRELMFADLTLSPACWTVLAKGLQSAKNLTTLRLNCCKLTSSSKFHPGIEKLSPVLSQLTSLTTLDLAGNPLTSPSGYWIGRVISAHNNYRDMEMWATNLRGAEEVVLTGLDEVVLADCNITDKVWLEVIQFLTNDSWLSCIDLRNCSLSKEVLNETLALMETNHTLMVLDLRGMSHHPVRDRIYELCARNISESLPDDKTEMWYSRFRDVLVDGQTSIFKSQFLIVPKETRGSVNWGSRSLNSTKVKSLDLSRSNISTTVTATPKTPKAPIRASHSLKRVQRQSTCTCCPDCSSTKAELHKQVDALTRANAKLKTEIKKLRK